MKRVRLRRLLLPLSIALVVITGISLSLLLLPPRWPEGAIFVPRDIPTLREALEGVEPGGTIVLQGRGGPFRGPVVVEVDRITIASSGPALLEGEGERPAIAIRADGVTVNGLRVTAPAIAVSVQGSGCRLERISIDSTPVGVRIVGSSAGEFSSLRVVGSRTAIEVSSSVGNSFDDLTIVSPGQSGIALIDSRANLIEKTVISGGKTGISLDGSDGNEFSAVTIEDCSDGGIRFRGSNENRFTDGLIRGVDTAVVIESAQGNVIADCRIEEARIGCSLDRAVQNEITQTAFTSLRDTGVIVIGGRENAISYNRFGRFGEAGIRIEGSERSSILANVIGPGERGIVSESSSESRILRNRISGMGLVGIALVDCRDDRILDNEAVRGPLGIVIVRSSGEVVLRNRIEANGDIGLALLDGSDNATVSENRIGDNATGALLAYSGREDVSENEFSRNAAGLRIYRTGPATRIERNTFVSNEIGLKQDETLDLAETSLGRLWVESDGERERASPIIVNNVFDRNSKFDVENDGSDPLYLAGNWWAGRDPEEAAVSSGVILPESAWKGRVTIGTATGIPDRILGYILRDALVEAGYRVVDLIGLGEGGMVESALESHDIDIAWSVGSEYTLPTGFDSLLIPAEERPIAVVSAALAGRLPSPTLSALADFGAANPLVVAAPRSLPAAEELVEAYGISPARGGIQWAALEEVEALLKFNAADLAIVPSLEESLTLAGFVPLADDRSIAEGEPIVLVFADDLSDRYPEIRGIIVDLASRLTGPVLHNLVSRVRLFDEPPARAAEEFFEKEGGYVE